MTEEDVERLQKIIDDWLLRYTDTGWLRDSDDLARAILDALSSSGRLVPEGSEVREEWGVAIDVDYALDARDEARARVIAEREGGTVESRRVITTPWTPTEPEEKPDA